MKLLLSTDLFKIIKLSNFFLKKSRNNLLKLTYLRDVEVNECSYKAGINSLKEDDVGKIELFLRKRL